VNPIHDYTAESLAAVAQTDFSVLLAFSTKYEPEHPLIQSHWWLEISKKYFDYHHDLQPEEIANLVQGRLVWQERRHGQWAGIIVRELPEDAQLIFGRQFDPMNMRMR
jgi:hypothetical protein